MGSGTDVNYTLLPEQNENIKRTQKSPANSETLHEVQDYHLETSDVDKTI
jgi:hypothetical protein